MRNKYFHDESITFNDLYFVCYMIERVARSIHQRNRYVANMIGQEGLWHELSTAATSHCPNPEEVVHEWIERYGLASGDVDVTKVNPKFTDKVPTATQMGKVYARLIQSVDQSDNLPETIIKVYESPVCDSIDNYNASAYYEPSYTQTRAFYNGGF